jgi:hypothetical protein
LVLAVGERPVVVLIFVELGSTPNEHEQTEREGSLAKAAVRFAAKWVQLAVEYRHAEENPSIKIRLMALGSAKNCE